MKKILISLSIILTLFIGVSCSDYLNVNKNVDTPDWVQPNLRLAPVLSGFVSNYYDMRLVGPMCQYFNGNGTALTYGSSMYYSPATDYAEVWKMVYYEWGQNVEDMINDGKRLNQPFYSGIGLALKAYGWYELTSLHGEAPCKEFLDPGRTVFDYDSQEYIFGQSRNWAKQAIAILSAPDAVTYPAVLTANDLMFKGDRTKWLKFAWGVLAKNYMTLSMKNPLYMDSAIVAVNNSMTSFTDDATITTAGLVSAQSNFFGMLRNNLSTAMNQSDYMVDVMTGRVKYYDPNTGNITTINNVTQIMAKQYVTDSLTLDPRSICFFGTTDSLPTDLTKINRKTYTFKGTLPGGGTQCTFMGTASTPTIATSGTGRWIFRDNAPYIAMTYAELQFIKAEAQFRRGLKAEALVTFQGAVAASMQTTGAYIVPGTPVKSGNKQTSVIGDKINSAVYNTLSTAYLNSTYVKGLALSDFELSHIMMQKYVALFPWGLDTWNDLRRYQYDLKVGASGVPSAADGSWTQTRSYYKTDTDPTRIYKGFYLGSADVTNRRSQFATTNLGSPSYRILPRYNSEYIWNQTALAALLPISGLAPNYNTSMVWFCIPAQQ
jgi:hypothetical protein